MQNFGACRLTLYCDFQVLIAIKYKVYLIDLKTIVLLN